MRKLMTWIVAGSMLGGAMIETLPAQAAVLRADGVTTPAASAALAETVQFRHHGGRPFIRRGYGGYRGHGYRGYRGYRDYGYHRRSRAGAAIAGGVLGLAAGAVVGSAIARQNAGDAAVRSCEARFRSYDPASGTYLGNDGRRHACP